MHTYQSQLSINNKAVNHNKDHKAWTAAARVTSAYLQLEQKLGNMIVKPEIKCNLRRNVTLLYATE